MPTPPNTTGLSTPNTQPQQGAPVPNAFEPGGLAAPSLALPPEQYQRQLAAVTSAPQKSAEAPTGLINEAAFGTQQTPASSNPFAGSTYTDPKTGRIEFTPQAIDYANKVNPSANFAGGTQGGGTYGGSDFINVGGFQYGSSSRNEPTEWIIEYANPNGGRGATPQGPGRIMAGGSGSDIIGGAKPMPPMVQDFGAPVSLAGGINNQPQGYYDADYGQWRFKTGTNEIGGDITRQATEAEVNQRLANMTPEQRQQQLMSLFSPYPYNGNPLDATVPADIARQAQILGFSGANPQAVEAAIAAARQAVSAARGNPRATAEQVSQAGQTALQQSLARLGNPGAGGFFLDPNLSEADRQGFYITSGQRVPGLQEAGPAAGAGAGAGAGPSQARQPQQEARRVTVKFYRNGVFTVDDGEGGEDKRLGRNSNSYIGCFFASHHRDGTQGDGMVGMEGKGKVL